MNRKQRRALSRATSPDASEKIAEKISHFNKMPTACSACTEPFDKKDKEMAQSWRVVVKQEVVRLFCPNCIQKTQDILNENKSSIESSSL